MKDAIDTINQNTENIFKHLKCECKHKENNKKLYLENNNGEKAFFFIIDKNYLVGGGKKADVLVYYYNTYVGGIGNLVLVELKGKNVKKAIKQLEDTIRNSKINKLWTNFSGNKYAGIICSSSPADYKKKKKDFEKKYHIKLTVIHRSKVEIKELM